MNANILKSIAPNLDNNQSPRALIVGGFTPFTFTDYPDKLAAVVFVQGCPWRCGYCHNPHLQPRLSNNQRQWSDVVGFLKNRIGLIDAVVFSGGEPTIDPALEEAIKDVRKLGFLTGLHTACIYPTRLKSVLPLVDWIGFDVKASFSDYQKITGIPDSGGQVQACIEMILSSGVDYECRTTIHPTLHSECEIIELAESLAEIGVKRYVLQHFRSQGCRDNALIDASRSTYPHFPGKAAIDRMTELFDHFMIRRS